LDYFQELDHKYDERFFDALDLLLKKEKNGRWPLQQAIQGKKWFQMEETGKSSR
jgi:hypothetical protein